MLSYYHKRQSDYSNGKLYGWQLTWYLLRLTLIDFVFTLLRPYLQDPMFFCFSVQSAHWESCWQALQVWDTEYHYTDFMRLFFGGFNSWWWYKTLLSHSSLSKPLKEGTFNTLECTVLSLGGPDPNKNNVGHSMFLWNNVDTSPVTNDILLFSI